VEVVAAICRRTRENSISLAERDRLIAVVRQDGKQSYNTLFSSYSQIDPSSIIYKFGTLQQLQQRLQQPPQLLWKKDQQ
jgi:hypothetical protein